MWPHINVIAHTNSKEWSFISDVVYIRHFFSSSCSLFPSRHPKLRKPNRLTYIKNICEPCAAADIATVAPFTIYRFTIFRCVSVSHFLPRCCVHLHSLHVVTMCVLCAHLIVSSYGVWFYHQLIV